MTLVFQSSPLWSMYEVWPMSKEQCYGKDSEKREGLYRAQSVWALCVLCESRRKSTCAQSRKQANCGQIVIPVWKFFVCLNNDNLCCIPTCGLLCLVAAKLPTICLWIIGCKTYICEPPVVHESICKSKQLGWQQQQLCSQILIQKPPTKIGFWKSVSWHLEANYIHRNRGAWTLRRLT